MKMRSLAATMLLLPLLALAQPKPLLGVADPEGDDVGDGTLVYPRDSAFTPGDLDLRSLRVFDDDAGLRFEATFRNPIRSPVGVVGPVAGSGDLGDLARHGFYSFNLDIYLDTDRLRGSGNTVTLPGRRATLDAAHAWDKAIVLTPRPEQMRRQLIDTLKLATPAAAGEVATVVDGSVHFATLVQVDGRSISFAVPRSFIDGRTIAGSSLTAIVTLAQWSADPGPPRAGQPTGPVLDRLTLDAAPPQWGRPPWAMGYTNDLPPATSVVDLLSPDVRQQPAQLAAGARLTGLNAENGMGAAPVDAGSWVSRAIGSVAGVFGVGAAATAPATDPAKAITLQALMSPQAARDTGTPAAVAAPTPSTATAAPAPVAPVDVSARPVPAATAPTQAGVALPPAAAATAAGARALPRPRDAAFFEEQEYRLRALKRLRESGLISEDEYQLKRREVLETL